METQASGAAGNNDDFSFEGENVFEVLELRLSFYFGSHGGFKLQ